MSKLFTAAVAVIVAIAYRLIGRQSDRELGKAKAERENAQRSLEQLREVNGIHRRLDSDPDYADQLRDKFIRKE